jgi:hypothetical protein
MSTPTNPNTPEFNQQLFDISCRLAKWFANFQADPAADPQSGMYLGHELDTLLRTNNVDYLNS